ncbi:MAG: DUF1080 domain-containing protein [Opitutaceae bacterium]|jgi:hypothetical protein|nr:DUF1080 domain-containing protein [Opitutaceae bacterium]
MKKTIPALLLVLAASTAIHAQSASDSRPPLPKPELTEQWAPVPPVVAAPAATGIPSDAIVLFDGSNLDAWESTDAKNPAPRWTLEPASRAMVVAPKTGNLRTKASFGDVQLHIEWRSPAEVKKSGQGRGNSGIFFMDLYELQVLDSYQNETYANGQAASIYKQFPPLANASRAPGEWQTYDAVFIAPRFKADGSTDTPARLTVFHNGVLVQHDTALRGGTEFRGLPVYKKHAARLPLSLQNHGGDLVAFRNIWVRELSFPPPPPIPDLPSPPYALDPKK